jgi:pimeloyl-ACP methyl ester carboxylesterase
MLVFLLAGCSSLPILQVAKSTEFEAATSDEWQPSSGPRSSSSKATVQQAGYLQESPMPFDRAPRPKFPQGGWWCSEFDEWLSTQRVENGYTIILPGIEGASFVNISIARGLVDAGHASGIEVHDWTTGYWPMFVYHLMALERNRAQAQVVARQIIDYQDRYPGRPVQLIGHSGGAAVAVMVLEALPEDRPIEKAVLLASALSPDYDLTKALSRTEHGIVNFYSGGDLLYLVAGTLALGTIDRTHAAAAGAVGFRVPGDASRETQRLYDEKLEQKPYQLTMAKNWNLGGHFGSANRQFVAEWVAPVVAAAPVATAR